MILESVRAIRAAREVSTYYVLIYDGSGRNQCVPYMYTYSGSEVYSG